MSGPAHPVVIRCVDLGARFEEHWVLRGVNLEIRDHEILGVIGPGGHGKSVLLKCLAGLVRPDEGRVIVKGQDLAKLGPKALAAIREDFGYLFQNYALFDFMTVFDNVAFPLRQKQRRPPEHTIARLVRERLTEVGLGHALQLYPRELSGGMKKRVGLARATVTDPLIGLYDDPSAGLDPVTSSKIFQLIQRMHHHVDGGATVVVSHDIDRMKAICQRYVMLTDGRVVYDGLAGEVEHAPEQVRDFFFGATAEGRGAAGGGP